MRLGKDVQLIWETYQNVQEGFLDDIGNPDSEINKIINQHKTEREQEVTAVKGELGKCPHFNSEEFDMINRVLSERAPDADEKDKQIVIFPYVSGSFLLKRPTGLPATPNQYTVVWKGIDRIDPNDQERQEWIHTRIELNYHKENCDIISAPWRIMLKWDESETIDSGDISINILTDEQKLRDWVYKLYLKVRRVQINDKRGADNLGDWSF